MNKSISSGNKEANEENALQTRILELEKQIEHLQSKAQISDREFRNVFEASNVGKSITRVSGEMYVNQAFSDMLGYDREELQMKSWKDITPAEDIEEIEKIIKSVYSTDNNAGLRIRKRYIRKDGSYIWTDVSGKLVYDENGNGFYHIATIIDISERVRIEEELEELNRELENKVKERTIELELLNQELQSFNYSVSHDLRAPLRIINTYAGLLKEEYSDVLSEAGKKYINSIYKSTQRMNALIDELLSLSKVSLQEVELVPVDMNDVVKSTFLDIATPDERNSFEFLMEVLPAVYCDPGLMKQVWENLIGNALKYSSKSEIKQIKIFATEKKKEVTYHISDRGAGYDPCDTPKLFTAFQRLHSSSEFPGNGVGLAIVQRIIKRHNGTIKATGKVGEGAHFSFTLKKNKSNNLLKPNIAQYPY